MVKVAKFGGSSVAGPEQFRKVKAIIEADPERQIAVISAAGKRDASDHKLTDLLYLCHAHITYGVSCDEIADTIFSRLKGIRDELGLSYDLETEFGKLRSRLNRDIAIDELVSRGEYFTARMMAEYLGFKFVDAAECVFFGYDGELDLGKTYEAIDSAYKRYGRIVIPGFYGSLPSGKIKVMSRGGSDITGAVAAAAVSASVYENWTDVSGILMADPRIVKDPSPIPEITYAELRELAFMGASVLHEESVFPVREKGIPLNIRNTNEPDHPGTLITDSVQAAEDSERFITGIAGRRDFSIITIVKRNLSVDLDLKTVLEILDRYHVPTEHITLGLDSFAVVCSNESLGERLYDIIKDIRSGCGPDSVDVQDGVSLIAAVGRKMNSRPGIAGKLFGALGQAGVNIKTIAQGSDELAITVGVDNSDYETAIKVLYEGFAG
ncbi:MAG: aspartate kinase [Oscillospiraceae bacterium]|nr:aspartate kinase [Oscillospiraceae bacterium]